LRRSPERREDVPKKYLLFVRWTFGTAVIYLIRFFIGNAMCAWLPTTGTQYWYMPFLSSTHALRLLMLRLVHFGGNRQIKLPGNIGFMLEEVSLNVLVHEKSTHFFYQDVRVACVYRLAQLIAWYLSFWAVSPQLQ